MTSLSAERDRRRISGVTAACRSSSSMSGSRLLRLQRWSCGTVANQAHRWYEICSTSTRTKGQIHLLCLLQVGRHHSLVNTRDAPVP